MNVGTLLIVAIAGLIAIMVGSCFYFPWVMKKMVFGQLQDLDEIRTTHQPPAAWQKAMHKKLESGASVSAEALAAQQQKNIKKLDRLVTFCEKTKLMEDEDTRKLVISELKQVRAEWEDAHE